MQQVKLKHFTNHNKKLWDCLIIILESYPRLHTKKHGEDRKILTPKQMLQRLPIALAQMKAGNTSENFSNEIRQIIYS